MRSLDTHLSEPRRIVLIGGAAASLAYGITRVTTDVDTIGDIADLLPTLRLVRAETGLDIPFLSVGIYDAPHLFEDRLVSIDMGLEKLQIVVPEKHDLVLMKVVRGQENDRDAIQQIAQEVGVDESTLIDRFKSEMTHVIGRPAQLRGNFLSVIELLYGEREADRVASELPDSAG